MSDNFNFKQYLTENRLGAYSKVGKLQEGYDDMDPTQAHIPDNIMAFAKRRGIIDDVVEIASWAEKAGKRIVGGTAIGKDYSTLILDLTHQGGEVRFNTDNETIEVNGMRVRDEDSFIEALSGSSD